MPAAAIAAAAWSWVLKMLQLAQRTSAPSAIRVSIRTAVWIVMWSEPVIRAPFSGCDAPYSSRVCIRPGISTSAREISLRPKSARPRSATLWSWVSVAVAVLEVIGAMYRANRERGGQGEAARRRGGGGAGRERNDGGFGDRFDRRPPAAGDRPAWARGH